MTKADRRPIWPGAEERLRQMHSQPDNLAAHPHDEDVYAAALALLPRPRYRSGLEIGCGIGALTERLARRCSALLAIDRTAAAIAAAQEHCLHLPQVQFQQMRVPEEYPSALFDLTIVSDAGCHWSRADLQIAQRRIVAHLETGGHLLLIHRVWTANQLLSDDAIHIAFLEQLPPTLRHLRSLREPCYRLDLFERT